MAVLGRIGHPSTTTHGLHTMTISLYQSSVPVFVRTLGNLSRILDKAVAHAADKGLDASTVDAALEGLVGTELERARVLWERKFGAPAPDAAGRARQVRFLLARGFASDTVRRVVRGVEDNF